MFGYFSSPSLCCMRIRKRMRIHENLFTVGKRTSPHVYSTAHVYSISTCLLYLHMSTLPPHVYSTSTCLLYLHISTLPPNVYNTSESLLYLHMSNLPPHVHSISKCLLYLHISTLLPHVYYTSTCVRYLHMCILYPREADFPEDYSGRLCSAQAALAR